MKTLKRSDLGFVRVAVGSHQVEVANCVFNASRIVAMMKRAQHVRAHLLILNELGATAYTCANLFRQETLKQGSLDAIETVRMASKSAYNGILVMGAPLEYEGELYNCAVVIHKGKILGVVPKIHQPNYGEFHEELWFASGENIRGKTIVLNREEVPFGIDLLFEASDFPGFIFGIENCEDGWAVIPPHRLQALAGATIIGNISASNELVAKDDYRRALVSSHASQAMVAYAYASAGAGESTTDVVFGGHLLIADQGAVLAEAEPLLKEESEPLRYADVDVQRIIHERKRINSFRINKRQFAHMLNFRKVYFKANAGDAPETLARKVDPYPFVPQDPLTLDKRCSQVFKILVAALEKRLAHLAKRRGGMSEYIKRAEAESKPFAVLGISGGIDSTLAFVVACKVFDKLGIPRKLLHCYTMPGFGTTKESYTHAHTLMACGGVTVKEVDIRARCLLAWQDEGYKPFGIDVSKMTLDEFVARLHKLVEEVADPKDLGFENKQARARTDILMNAGFVLGTGTLTELAAGWCTYNADHMSMYGISAGVAKTMSPTLIKWASQNEFDGEMREVLLAIAASVESPHLLPADKSGKSKQSTNSSIGPKDLRDFFLYEMIRWGSSPAKILYLVGKSKYASQFTEEEVKAFLKLFIERFFDNRFKHSCLPDGVKLGSVSLNPRYDCHIPSDTSPEIWLAELNQTIHVWH